MDLKQLRGDQMARIPVYSRHRRTTPPCMGCEKRKVGCHSVCDGYKGWKEGELQRMKQANDSCFGERMANDYVVKKIRNIKANKG